MHAALMLSQDDDEDSTLRLYALGLTAWADPSAAGALASELPDLAGPDPHTEPTARRRALQWAADAHDATNTPSTPDPATADTLSPDARTLLDHFAEQTGDAFDDWDLKRLVHAAAEAAAAVLAGDGTDADDVIAVFADSGPATDWDSEMEYHG